MLQLQSAVIHLLISVTSVLCLLTPVICNLSFKCPQNCTCSMLDSFTLHMDCDWKRSDHAVSVGASSDASLETEINAVLVNLSALQDLSIIRSSLRRIPSQICLLSNLIALNLSANRLENITDGCWTQLKQLQSFDAHDNNITTLQVRQGLVQGTGEKMISS